MHNHDIKPLIDHARRQGWAVERRASNHLIFRPPDRAIPAIVTASTTQRLARPVKPKSQPATGGPARTLDTRTTP